jgi:hypothetical protein
MIDHLCAVLLVVLLAPALRAEDEGKKNPRRSSFDRDKIHRDPFERIDAKFLAAQSVNVLPVDAPVVEDLEKFFRVTGVSLDRLHIAIINGIAVVENEQFIVKTKGKEIRGTVVNVTMTGVELECGGKLFTIPVTRKKLSLTEEMPAVRINAAK